MFDVCSISLKELRGVGKKRFELYHRLGIETAYALLRFYPRSYLDFSRPVLISQAQIGEYAALRVLIAKKQRPFAVRKGMTIMKAQAIDSSGKITIVIYNNRFAFEKLVEGKEYLLYGKVGGNLLQREINSPVCLSADENCGMQPVYSLTEGLTSNMVITNMKEALLLFDRENAEDPLPAALREEHELMTLGEALHAIHFPKNQTQRQRAHRRLVFEELLSWQMGLAMIKEQKKLRTNVLLREENLTPFLQALPFTLTDAQKKVIDECIVDCKKGVPMNRLVQGDVGSGKTMVAAALIYLICKSGYQAALMAPTEVLALQHYETLKKLFTPLGLHVSSLTGSMNRREKDFVKWQLAAGKVDLAVGTHALVQDSTSFASLGLVITDEQHRFGVAQREKLSEKGNHPHTMVMSATPIPRTLALILYGDLDISFIHALPAGRQKIATYAIGSSIRGRALKYIRDALDRGRQAYIVCPNIEDSERGSIGAISYAKALKKGPFRDYTVGILHSKMNAKDKNDIMFAFKRGEIQLLVSTTVIEVGVDVPNAVIMMIENAELFGLSQLHQLRGRVGRGKHASTCILVSSFASPENKVRLKTLCETSDGFAIAEKDLQLRGPGDFFGRRQHGLPEFKIADIGHDIQILECTRSLAADIIVSDPNLSRPENAGMAFLVHDLFHSEYSVL